MPTKTQNTHFSERLYYVDSIFSYGNRIINLYDATGRKYKSIVYTIPATAVTSSYDLEHKAYGIDSVEYHITEYNGNIETCYTPRDTTIRIFNSIGYWTDSAYYYMVNDHLGNICAVVNSTADTVVQRTMYYASGVPMAESTGRDAQPYLYNGKEFVEAHGWNTYDYGFRGYYATIGRFTSIDPLAEQTPWQSPYVYANNNFINKIDFMGLSGDDGFAHDYGDVYWNGDLFGIGGCSSEWNPWSWSIYGELVDVCNWAAIDGFGNIVGWGNEDNDFDIIGLGSQVLNYIVINRRGEKIGGVDDGDNGIYLSTSGKWDKDTKKTDLEKVGTMLPWWCGIDYYGMPNGRLVPGLYDGQFYTDVTISVGLQVYVPTPIGDIGINVVSWDAVSLSKNMKTGEKKFDYFGNNGEARINTLQFSLLGAGYKYSIKHELLGDMRYVAGSNTSSVHMFGCFRLGIDGSFGLCFSIGVGIMTSWSITGNAYYGH